MHTAGTAGRNLGGHCAPPLAAHRVKTHPGWCGGTAGGSLRLGISLATRSPAVAIPARPSAGMTARTRPLRVAVSYTAARPLCSLRNARGCGQRERRRGPGRAAGAKARARARTQTGWAEGRRERRGREGAGGGRGKGEPRERERGPSAAEQSES